MRRFQLIRDGHPIGEGAQLGDGGAAVRYFGGRTVLWPAGVKEALATAGHAVTVHWLDEQ